MVAVADAVVNERAVMVEAFDALSAGHAMHSCGRPYGPTEETEVVQIPLLPDCLMQVVVKVFDWYTLGVPWVFEMDEEEADEGHGVEEDEGGQEADPDKLILQLVGYYLHEDDCKERDF